ncbi:MAG: nucleoside deaminase [Coleofasciculaceae cyanobacterium]
MHEQFIKETINLARQAREKGNEPFGSCLVKDGQIILTAENTIHTDNDPTKHAETNLVSHAAQMFDAKTLNESILYTSTEPCAMCAGAIYWAGIRTVVFGCSIPTLNRIASPSLSIFCRDVLATGVEATQVIGPVLEEEAMTVHEGFWKQESEVKNK